MENMMARSNSSVVHIVETNGAYIFEVLKLRFGGVTILRDHFFLLLQHLQTTCGKLLIIKVYVDIKAYESSSIISVVR